MIRRERYAAGHPKASKKPRVSETVARPTRTAGFAALAALILTYWSSHVNHLSRDELATYGVLLTALINAAWVAVENQLGKAVLRDVPPRTAAVVDGNDQAGESAVGVALLVLVVLVIVAVLFRVF